MMPRVCCNVQIIEVAAHLWPFSVSQIRRESLGVGRLNNVYFRVLFVFNSSRTGHMPLVLDGRLLQSVHSSVGVTETLS